MTHTETVLSATPDPRGAIRAAWPLASPHRRLLAIASITSVVATAATLAGPVLIGHAVDAVTAGSRQDLTVAVAGLAIATTLLLVFDRARRTYGARASEAVLADLRTRLAGRLLARPLQFFDRHPTGELLARSTNDVDGLSAFVRTGLPRLVDAALLLAATVTVLAVTSWQLALVGLAYLPALTLAVRRFNQNAPAAYSAWTQAEADTTAAIAETVAGRPFLQGIGATTPWATNVAAIDQRLLDANDHALRADNRLSVLGFWQHLVLAAVLVVGAELVVNNTISIGAVATVALALRQLFAPLDDLSWLYADAQRARAHLARILELLDTHDLPQRHGTNPRPTTLRIEFHNVSYRYRPDLPDAVTAIDLVVEPGEHLVFVGATGSGKSTIAKLAAGLLTPTTGDVLIGNHPTSEWPPHDLRDAVVVIPQEPFTIAGTLADNLRLVPGEHTDDDLLRAATATGLADWITALPNGLATRIADHGTNLSSGERQLLALIRAALADPAVLILDETTAHIDPTTEQRIAFALDTVGTGRTLIVVAHRPDTAARARRRVVIADGRIQHTPPTDLHPPINTIQEAP
jgi:ABC-type multidrug transport system fused ATPase/permease subunit